MSEVGTDLVDLQSFENIDLTIHSPARLKIMAYLYVVESVSFVFLINLTHLTWGNLSTHLSKLEKEGYVDITKEFRGKKPHTMIQLTEPGRQAFRAYKKRMQRILDDLPD
jgi:DNA-binding MarR family transcriptional regulator